MAGQAQRQMTPDEIAAQNLQARALIVGRSKRQQKTIYNQKIDVAASRQIVIPLHNVGLINRLYANVHLRIKNNNASGGASLTRSAWGGFNTIKNVRLTDHSSNDRIICRGRELAAVNSVRSGRGHLAAESYSGFVADYGQTNTRVNLVDTIAAQATRSVFHTMLIPLAYSRTDLTGSLNGNVSNATAYLTLQLPDDAEQSATSGAAGDQTAIDAIYVGGPAQLIEAYVEVVQEHYDALPGNGAILPFADLSQIYEIKSQRYTEGFAPGGEVKVPFANGRKFLSVAANFLNGNAPAYDGEDLDKIILQQANTYRFFERNPVWFSVESRERMGLDSPVGHYFYDTRESPIVTEAAGNIELVFRLKSDATVSAGARVEATFEALGPAPLALGTGIASI